MSVQQLRAETTSREFVEWLAYFRHFEFEEQNRESWYLAQIAAEIAKLRTGKPRGIKVSQYLLKFEKRVRTNDPNEPQAVRFGKSKRAWFGSIPGAKKKS